MNIEELELSLRSEFEGQLNSVVARLRQDVADFQVKFQAEFQKHREQLDRSIDELATRLPETYPLESAFKSTITEHLRLARDEGAQIAATAFGEAEKLKTESASAHDETKYDLVRDAINDITSRRSQAAILTALVEHASRFAPRGAFFIVKNHNFVGWKAFGADSISEEAVREIRFTTKCHSTLSEAVGLLSTISTHFGAYADDYSFLEPLRYGQPAEMYAIPLSARGRGVAVLYADKDPDGNGLNVEALETLVRVAGLTVELLAAQSAKPQTETAEKPEYNAEPAVSYEPAHAEAVSEDETAEDFETVEEVQEPASESVKVDVEQESGAAAETGAPEFSDEVRGEPVPTVEYEFETTASTYEAETPAVSYEIETTSTYEFESTSSFEPVAEYAQPEEVTATFEAEEPSAEPTVFEPVEKLQTSSDFEFVSNESYDASAAVETVENAVPHVEFAAEEVSVVSNGNGYVHVPEPAATPTLPEPVEATVQAAKPRLSDRNVDLPIEVADEERKLHNDARRFARLLVSEIKLYNEQQVTQGREQNDLYDRLREAIDRSREMYEKRVKPAVASKFDYFNYELVNGLAEGDAKKLGGNYPGATV